MQVNFLNTAGSVYVSDLIKIAIYLSIIFTFIYIPAPFIQYIKLTHMGEAVLDHVQRNGAVTNGTASLVSQLSNKYNINPVIEYKGNFIEANGEKRIQLKEEFSIVLTDKVKVFTFLPNLSEKMTYYIDLRKEIVGVGHYYWRDNELQ